MKHYLMLPIQFGISPRKLHFGISHVKIILKITTFQAK